jgi:hypothetical protein
MSHSYYLLKVNRRIGVAIGEQILDLSIVATFYPEYVQHALRADVLNPLMELGFDAWSDVRRVTTSLLLTGSDLHQNAELQKM